MKIRLSIAFMLTAVLCGCGSMKLDDLGGKFGAGDLAGKMGNVPGTDGKVDLGQAVGAATQLAKAATLTDDEVRQMALQFSAHFDSTNAVMPADGKESRRLSRLTGHIKQVDGIKLNFRVYDSPEINAFAVADGSIRIYKGLMERFPDDEVMGVVGHEVGHVRAGHTAQAMRVKYAAAAAINSVGAMNNVAGMLASKDLLGGLAHEFITAQFSQSNEEEADDYSLAFLQQQKMDPNAAIRVLEALARLEEEQGEDSKAFRFFSSHPGAGTRAERLKEALANGKIEIPPAKVGPMAAGGDAGGSAVTTAAGNKVATARLAGRAEAQRAAKVSESSGVQAGYYVQLLASQNPESAQAKLTELSGASFGAVTQEAVVDGTHYTRVLVGPYSNRSGAQYQLDQLKALGFAEGEPFVRRIR